MKRPVRVLLSVVVLAGILLAGCGVRPSGVITGGPAPAGTVDGVRFYLIADGEPALVLRGLKPTAPDEVLRLLAAGPSHVEQQEGFSSEVPAAIVPATVGFDGDSTLVSLSTDVRTLSVLAVVQIVCTVQATTDNAPVTLVSGEQRRGPLRCPAYN